jgi:hypothetical protein
MAIPTWSQLTFLTAAQQSKAAEFATIGQAYTLWQSGRGPKPDISGVTQSQAKTADGLLRDLITLVGPAQQGIKYVKQVNEQIALDAYQAANP